MTKWIQREVKLPIFNRGFHLITRKIEEAVPELKDMTVGLANVFILHTSASLTVNENADPTVRADFESHFNHMVSERADYLQHTYEGPDDSTAHLKASILGQSVCVPIKDGKLHLGTWQGVYLCEHRNNGGHRRLVITLSGE